MRVAVVGASGGMGSFFVRYFLERGETVRTSDTRRGRREATPPPSESGEVVSCSSNREAVEGCDVTVLAVPMEKTVSVAREVAGGLQRGSTLVEIASVKGGEVESLRRLLGGRANLLSVHPLFGPALRSTRGMKMAVISAGGRRKARVDREVRLARSLFPDARLVPMSRAEHDMAMAVVLSLTHLLNMVYAGTVSEFISPAEFRRLSTPNSSLQLTLAEAVLAQDVGLSYAIQARNAYAPRVARKALLELERVMKMVEREDREGFGRHLDALSRTFGARRAGAAAAKEVYASFEGQG